MEKSPLTDRLLDELETMPPRLRAAARFVLEHPAEVAWMSMREQGRRAGVSHSTMVRLAAWLGLDSYDDLRAHCAQAWRVSGGAHLKLAGSGQSANGGEISTIAGIADSFTAQMMSLGRDAGLKRLVAAASVFIETRRLFCFGMHSGEMIAYHFAEVMSRLGRQTAVVTLRPESDAGIAQGAGAGDAMLVANFAPYSQATDKLARQMSRRGVAIVAITDSKVSPLQRIARESIIVPTNAHALFPSMTTAFAAIEILAVLTAGKSSADAEEGQNQTELKLAASGV